MSELQQNNNPTGNVPSPEQIKKNKRIMILLFVMFLTPIISAVFIFNNDPSGSYATKNRGNLITPAIELKNIELEFIDTKKSYKLIEQEHQWLMVFVGAGECDESCKRQLVVMRQTRLAQGGEFTRVNRLYVIQDQDKQSDKFMKEVKEFHPGMDVVTGSKQQLENITKQFTLADKVDVGKSNRIYIVDPIGNLMMYYEFDAKASDIAKDLTRLLKVSQMG